MWMVLGCMIVKRFPPLQKVAFCDNPVTKNESYTDFYRQLDVRHRQDTIGRLEDWRTNAALDLANQLAQGAI